MNHATIQPTHMTDSDDTKRLATLADHVTDIVGITGIAATAYFGVGDPAIIGGIVSIALGKRYVKAKQ